jgi:hypothetical protein
MLTPQLDRAFLAFVWRLSGVSYCSTPCLATDLKEKNLMIAFFEAVVAQRQRHCHSFQVCSHLSG